MSRNKEIVLWVNISWANEKYSEVVDTGVPVSQWDEMSDGARQAVCDEVIREEVFNLVEWGWHE